MPHQCADELVMLAELTVKPDRRDDFLDYTIANLAISRAWPGNIRFDIWLDDADPGRICFYEVWKSAADQQAYMAWRIGQGDLDQLMQFLADAPRFTAMRRVMAPDEAA